MSTQKSVPVQEFSRTFHLSGISVYVTAFRESFKEESSPFLQDFELADRCPPKSKTLNSLGEILFLIFDIHCFKDPRESCYLSPTCLRNSLDTSN